MEVTQESSLIMTQTAQQQDKVTMDYSCLPNDVWLRVMELLCPRDRYRMARTCSLFHELFQHPSFWRRGFLDLTQAIRGEEGSVCLGLRRRSKLVAESFGYFFHHIRFHVPNCQVAIDDSTLELLTNLCESWTVKTVSLVVSSYGTQCSVYGRDTGKPSCLHAAVNVLKSARDLVELDLRQWPVTSDVLAEHERDLGIDRVLADAATFPGLTSLDITWKFNPCSANSVVQRSPQTAVDLATKFRCLRHLSLRHVLLSETLLRELACGANRSPLRSLSVTCEYDEYSENNDVATQPQLSEAAWTLLKGSCPNLEVRLTVKAADLQLVEWALEAYVPVFSVDLTAYGSPLSEEWLRPLTIWRDTLKALTVGGYYAGQMPCVDHLLVDLVTSCTKLQHLVYHGKISDSTVAHLASLGRKWTVFKFV